MKTLSHSKLAKILYLHAVKMFLNEHFIFRGIVKARFGSFWSFVITLFVTLENKTGVTQVLVIIEQN